MPVIFAELAATYPPKKVCDPRSPIAAANGQYLLIRRDAYDAIGGHAAVATALLEDVELAKRLKRAGFVLYFSTSDALSTRMYRSFPQLWEGWTKNLALLFPNPRWLALQRTAEFVIIVALAVIAVLSLTRRSIIVFAVVVAIVALCFYFFQRRIGRAHFDQLSNALAFFGLPLFAVLLLNSSISLGTARSAGRDASILAEGTFIRVAESISLPGIRRDRHRDRYFEPKATSGNMVYLTRKCEFSASHYYHNPEFSEEENQRIFGKCANLNGHGHNYTLEVTVKGDVDPKTGFVVDLKELKEILNREVFEALDHRHLNKEVPEFAQADSHDREPGDRHLESPARQVAGRKAASGAGVRTARSVRGFLRRSMKVYLTRRYLFSASHRLHSDGLSDAENRATYGKCNNPHGHGHNYALEVTVSGQSGPENGNGL